MEIIEKLPGSEYDDICSAGVDLVGELKRLLARHGLNECHAFNVLIVAAAGVTADSELSSVDLANGVDSVIHMWHVRNDSDGRVMVFDPTHVPPGHVPADQVLRDPN